MNWNKNALSYGDSQHHGDNKPTWELRYMKLAQEVSTWSKDPSSKIGAIAIGSKGQVLAQGYNGFPRGVKDTKERLSIREKKLKYTIHAEMNCIFNATFNGVSLDNSTMFVYGLPPCSDCAKGITQVGVHTVFMNTILVPDRWKESWELTKEIFSEGGVKWKCLHV